MSAWHPPPPATEALLQLQDRHAFERPLPRTVLFGALAGGIFGLLSLPLTPSLTILSLAVLSVTAFVGDRLDRLLLSLPALALPALGWVPASPTWQLALAGALSGLLWIQAERCRLRHDVPLSPRLPGAQHAAVCAVATAGLAVWGTEVGARLAGALLTGGAPTLLAAAASGATLALFVALGRLIGHVGREDDPLLTRLRQLLTQLPPDAEALVQRMLRAHQAAQAVLADVAAASTREAWAQSLRRAMEHLIARAEDLARLPPGDGPVDRRQRLERAALALHLARTDDALTRAQLTEALEAMDHEARGREALRVDRERTLAQLHAGTALLEQGQLALQRTRNAQAADRAEALASASRHLRALATMALPDPSEGSADGDLRDPLEAGLGTGDDPVRARPAARDLEHIA